MAAQSAQYKIKIVRLGGDYDGLPTQIEAGGFSLTYPPLTLILDTGGATTGSATVETSWGSEDPFSIDIDAFNEAGIQAAIDTQLGTGHALVKSLGGNLFSCKFLQGGGEVLFNGVSVTLDTTNGTGFTATPGSSTANLDGTTTAAQMATELTGLPTIGTSNIAVSDGLQDGLSEVHLIDVDGATTGTLVYNAISLNSFTLTAPFTATRIRDQIGVILGVPHAPTVVEVSAGRFTLEYNNGVYAGVAFNPPEVINNLTDGPDAFAYRLTVGNVRTYWILEFGNELANTEVDDFVISYSAQEKADTITVLDLQEGVSDIPLHPVSYTDTEAAEADAGEDEMWTLDLAGASTGEFKIAGDDGGILSGLSNPIDPTTADETVIQEAIGEVLDTIFGSGPSTFPRYNIYVPSPVGDVYSIYFTADKGLQPLGVTFSISANTTGASITITKTTPGRIVVEAQNQIDYIEIYNDDDEPVSAANFGSIEVAGQTLAFNQLISELTLPNTVATGYPLDGYMTIVWQDFDSHTPLSVSNIDLSKNGQKTRRSICLSDRPNHASSSILIGVDGSSYSAVLYNATVAEVAASISTGVGGPYDWTGVSGDGSPEDPWIIETSTNQTVTSFEVSENEPLYRECKVVQETLVEGQSPSESTLTIPMRRMSLTLSMRH